jgi:O-antigen/teichoic acid export membrane protein
MSDAGAPRLRHALPPVYAAAALRVLLPLLVLPLVAVRVGPEEFGRLSFILVWSGLLSTLVEGGFLAAATRLAVNADAADRWRIAQQVFSARCALSLPVLLGAWLVVAIMGGSGSNDAWAIAALAVALGWPATWYLQATQQLSRWARVEFAVYASLIAACWVFADRVAVFVALQFAASALLAVLGWRWLRRDLQTVDTLWSAPQIGPGLRLGWSMLPVSIAGAAYSLALPAAASAQLGKPELGLYFMADRIVRAVLAAGEPVFAVVYPRIVGRLVQGTRAAARYALRWAAGGMCTGALLYLAGALAWPGLAELLAHRAAGLDLARLAGVIAILGVLLPLLLGWKFIGYWMLATGRYDRAYRACVVVGGVVGVAGAATVGGAGGAHGLAWTALAVELVVIAVALLGIGLTERRAVPAAG